MAKKYDSLTDEELVSMLQTSDENAFEAIYRRQAHYLYHYAYNILEDDEACQDAVQDVFVWLWNHREQVRISRMRPYLRAAIKYRLVRSIQRSRRREAILNAGLVQQPDTYTNDEVEVRDLQELIDALVDKLPPRAREIFCLSRREYLSNKEIAKKLQLSEKTVENQMTIALRKLKAGLGRLSIWIYLF